LRRHTHKWGTKKYRPGDEWDECDRCGFDYLKSELVVEPDTKYVVCRPCLDEHDPQRYGRTNAATRREI
jgi:hypothetical protein